ncbi:MAG: hypothetical protein KAW92_09270 [Candidatus Cloacimonetes bacterium]|nr:hypothetical protein [Candidatus Cloacimonadota bacterium]
MKVIIFILNVIILFVLLCCSYDEPESKDKIPPSKVHLIPHRCDPGDPGCTYTDKNNGIDPVQSGNPDDNWMRIQWGDELIKDPDIDHIDVYRYNNEDTTKVMVDRIDYHLDSTQYVDKFNGVDVVIQRTWSYYIIPYDEADNFTNSDTVSYRLLGVPGLITPEDNDECGINENILFSWNDVSLSTLYRIIFFDSTHSFITSNDIDSTGCNIVPLTSGLIPGYTYIWRIDAFGAEYEPGRRSGSESEERRITFSSE